MHPYTLRARSEGDAPFLLTLYASTRQDALDWGWPEAALRGFLRAQFLAREAGYRAQYPGAEDWVIERGGRPVGRMILHVSEALRLVDIALQPEARGQGLGARILRDLQARGGPILLSVLSESPARRLYARLGFELVEEGPIYAALRWSPPHTRT